MADGSVNWEKDCEPTGVCQIHFVAAAYGRLPSQDLWLGCLLGSSGGRGSNFKLFRCFHV